MGAIKCKNFLKAKTEFSKMIKSSTTKSRRKRRKLQEEKESDETEELTLMRALESKFLRSSNLLQRRETCF